MNNQPQNPRKSPFQPEFVSRPTPPPQPVRVAPLAPPIQPQKQAQAQLDPVQPAPVAKTPEIRPKKRSLLKKLAILVALLILVASIVLAGIYGNSLLKLAKSTAQAKSNAEIVKVYAETFNKNRSEFPDETLDFEEGTVDGKPLADLVKLTTDLDQDNGETSIIYQYVGKKGNASGGRILYYDFGKKSIGTEVIYLGDANQKSTFIDLP